MTSETWEQMEARHMQERADMMQRMIADNTHISRKHKREMALSRIAAEHGVTVEGILGDSRVQDVANARQHAYAELRGMGYSLQQVGRFVGDRDHKSVVHGIEAHERRTQAA